MWQMAWPILIAVLSNTVYNIAAKSTPGDVNPFASPTVTYLTATLCSVAMIFLTGGQRGLTTEIGKTNWTAYALGVAIVGLEFGFLCIYRAGWEISVGNLVASVTLACVLLLVGTLLYHERISLRQVLGMGICALGLALVVKR